MVETEEAQFELSYDPDGDMLEFLVPGKAAVTYPTSNEHVMVRIDSDGRVVGVMVRGVSAMGEAPFDLKLSSIVASKRKVTTSVAAREMGISVRRLQALLQQGRVEGAERVGRDWLVPLPAEVRPGLRGPQGVAKRKRNKFAFKAPA
ncbi:MAG: DUF2283 domain-containing protein [SAR202 cluster bacterium]|nr:DUF2283 domain-containing protein [SAR202 cluster bacterium]